jgi:hypothetical protein
MFSAELTIAGPAAVGSVVRRLGYTKSGWGLSRLSAESMILVYFICLFNGQGGVKLIYNEFNIIIQNKK